MLGPVLAILGLLEVIVWAAFVSVAIWPFAVVPRGKREKYTIHPARLFGWLCIRVTCWARPTLLGLQNLPSKPGYLVICNHRSWADVGILILHTWSLGISKKEVAYVPFFGFSGWLAGVIFFDRKKRMERARVVTEAVELMKSGANLHVFPEGTRTRDGRLREKVFLRLVQACWEAEIDVVPACVWGTERAVPAEGMNVRLAQPMGLELAAPLPRASFQSGDAFAEASWAKVREMAGAHGADAPFTA
jgi:1-acyl-sn-glycerol-3-phosphate acyltransferase